MAAPDPEYFHTDSIFKLINLIGHEMMSQALEKNKGNSDENAVSPGIP